MRRPVLLLLVAALGQPLSPQDAPPPAAPFRLVQRQREAAPVAGPAWADSFDAAAAAAKQRHVRMLLYFTAKW